VWPEGLGKLKKNHLIGYRIRDLAVCSIVPYPLRYCVPHVQNGRQYKLRNATFVNLSLCTDCMLSSHSCNQISQVSTFRNMETWSTNHTHRYNHHNCGLYSLFCFSFKSRTFQRLDSFPASGGTY
jgi:hypothetical protein